MVSHPLLIRSIRKFVDLGTAIGELATNVISVIITNYIRPMAPLLSCQVKEKIKATL